MITLEFLLRWFDKLNDEYSKNKNYLTDLDAAIGDADHGINISRGYQAIVESIETNKPETPQALFKLASETLIKIVGGTSGPLLGTFFMRVGRSIKNDPIQDAEFCECLKSGAEALMKLGRSSQGEKTLLDALLPALDALKNSLESGVETKAAFAAAAAAAKEGMQNTIPMLATKGRASYLGERSIGHQDPGATSTYLMFKVLEEI
jgi:dihydroxyacetone kinase-like protein